MFHIINDSTIVANGGAISQLTPTDDGHYTIEPGIVYKLDVGPFAKLYSQAGNTQLVVITGHKQFDNWGSNAKDFPSFVTDAYTFQHETPWGTPYNSENNRLKPTSARCMLFYDTVDGGFATIRNIPSKVNAYVFSVPKWTHCATHYDLAAQIAIKNCTDPRLRAWWADKVSAQFRPTYTVRMYGELKQSVLVVKHPVELLSAQFDDILEQTSAALGMAKEIVTTHTKMLSNSKIKETQLVKESTRAKENAHHAVEALVAVVKIFPWDPKELQKRHEAVFNTAADLDMLRVQLTTLRHVSANVEAHATGVTEAKAYIAEFGTGVGEAIAVLKRAAAATKNIPGLLLPPQERFVIDEADEPKTIDIENNMTRLEDITNVISTVFPGYQGDYRLVVTMG
jgi:hypothetical protein